MICVGGDAVSTSPEESGGGEVGACVPSEPAGRCVAYCAKIAVPVDVGLVAEGRDPVNIGVCWCRIPQRARVGEPDNLQVALT
jgi:hypothetical protein